MKDVLVVVPTYNEIDSLPILLLGLEEVRQQMQTDPFDVLVIDDSSPDGTGEWVTQEAVERTWLQVLIRPGKHGLGSAYREAFQWAYEHDYRVLIQMDADGSHRPSDILRLIKRLGMPDTPDLVIASRRVPGSKQSWALRRRLLSLFGNIYIGTVLGLSVKDATAGFRAYQLNEELLVSAVNKSKSNGYGIQVEMTALCKAGEKRVVEIPTEFKPRLLGQSKLSFEIAAEQLKMVNRLGLIRFRTFFWNSRA